MIKVYIASSNPNEAEILDMAFSQYSYNVLRSTSPVSCYLEIVQFKPDIILIELTSNFMDQISAVKLIRANRILKNIPIIGFGNHRQLDTISQFIHVGISKYFLRPLKIGLLMSYISDSMKKRGIILENTLNIKTSKANKDLIDILLNTKILKEEKLEQIADGLGALMSFPFAISKIIESTESKDTGANDLSKAISTDSAISSSILKISNSVQFHSQNREIKEIKDAIVRVGFNEVKNIAIGLSVMKIVPKTSESFGFDTTDFWFHSLSVAIICQNMAIKTKYSNPSLAFLGGLLHEFGTLLLDEFFPQAFKDNLQENTRLALAIEKTQSKKFGLNQIDLAVKMFKKWNLPKELIHAIENQINFENLDPKSVDSKLAILIGFADIYSKTIKVGHSCDNVVKPIKENFMVKSQLANMFNQKFNEEIYEEIKQFSSFLGLEGRPIPEERKVESLTPSIAICSYTKEHNFHLSYIETLGYKILRINDPAEVEEVLTQNEVFCFIVDTDENTSLTEIDLYTQTFNIIGQLEGKPKTSLICFSAKDYKIKAADLKAPWITVDKESDLRIFEHELQKLLS